MSPEGPSAPCFWDSDIGSNGRVAKQRLFREVGCTHGVGVGRPPRARGKRRSVRETCSFVGKKACIHIENSGRRITTKS